MKTQEINKCTCGDDSHHGSEFHHSMPPQGEDMKQYTPYTPLTKLLILIGLTVVSWTICGLVIYKALQFAVKVFRQGI